MIREQLKIRWKQFIEPYNLSSGIAEKIFAEIITAYTEPHRHYHNLSHIAHVFRELDSFAHISSETKISAETTWAVWFHDFIYQPGDQNNEEKSAEWARYFMKKAGANQTEITRVESMILSTQSHDSRTVDSETQRFLDADMAILGADRQRYFQYVDAVRKEHSKIPNFLFNRGRRRFLENTLEQQPIFSSDFFNKKYENIALRNIQSEIDYLNAPNQKFL
ncbi:HD domain-containing protein [Aliikangiella coralliicola]|uniref:N-methyl-D-aspartate receptor NMDAR2C subunit n=1 Tax=Aliikangiella coralliicola TaxID=2592383 RepID=A0A545UIN8_9GAMM|nr:hypothetical protein [Aliikangiella coralliicola]TQV89331.1 hypothetical protein FLL46_00155 [Aliikangiella coralliicola]